MNWMGNLQQFGRSLMLPTIILPVASVLLWLGAMPWGSVGMEHVGILLHESGDFIFTYMPFLFAVGVALGLTENASIAGLSALLSYALLSQMTDKFMPHFHMGVTGGILIGILSALCFHRFKNIQLPESIQYFGGPRFVPLVMGLLTLLLSFTLIEVGPTVLRIFTLLGETLIGLGGFGAFLYGVAYRLLVPSGLHHILNNVYWFQLGSFTRADGTVVIGDLPRYFAGDPTAGVYMAGLYPIMMFALPAVALAIIQEAREDLKPKVKRTFLTAALASFLTGVTEPIEFAFLFVAPMLFFAHALLSGVSMWIAYELGIRHGFSFSAGAIDFFLNEHLATRGLWLIPIGIVYAYVYFLLFRWAIRRFQLPTPGREEGSSLEEWAGDIPYRSPLILQALGGKGNIRTMEACITRLRLTLENDKLIDTAALKHLGAAGVIRLGGGNVQVVFGTFSELIREEIVKVTRQDFKQVLFHSPMQGRMIPLEDVPDAVFARKIVGDGVAFIPDRGELVAPVAGTIVHLYPTHHALGIRTEDGLEVLLHIGIDTVQLEDGLFTAFVKEGDVVEAGQLLVRFNLPKVKQHAKSLATPMLITNTDRIKSWSFAPFKAVKKGQGAVMSVVLKEENASGGGHDQ
ncbi:PTS system glucose-specific EIICBA component [Paenibacillus sp. J31TS4]|uniref:glucose PTS transporter subunit IIA n=1 Tax=Paenibacillus sp. J31TS4 TaxID=2807195 RepID=UPI001B06FB5B|nr:glucose PTS transporter subunit IIA [Paenibacillus sp. J31TS4]GIP39764.1 PTS system glucose-specific EIICBA component [Paenibacillus sp. J31TS4]